MHRKAADIHEYDGDIDDHNVATWRAEAIEKKEITQMEELEELVEVRWTGPADCVAVCVRLASTVMLASGVRA